jgi:superkiller protein 3
VTFTRADALLPRKPTRDATPAAAKTRRERARALMRDGAAWLREGNFESARGQFLAAVDVDPALPEAYNGVGVTFRMRNDQEAALDWYKKSLAVNPDFGDAYYNMACVYALQGKKDLALRYLQIAALNGYASAEGIDEDPDLESLRDEPAYRALLKAHL